MLVLFPEGTSNDGNSVLPFKSALLAAAEAMLEDGRPVPVQPVSTAYIARQGIPMGRENRPLYAWYGDMELVPHLWEALVAGPLDVVVQFHDPLPAMDRKQLAHAAWDTVRKGQAARAGRAYLIPPSACHGAQARLAAHLPPIRAFGHRGEESLCFRAKPGFRKSIEFAIFGRDNRGAP